MTDLDQEKILKEAEILGQKWVDAFKPDGNANVEAIQEVLSKRVFQGEPVTAFTVRSPQETVDLLRKLYDEAPKEDKDHLRGIFSRAHECIWDYWSMAFYETTCSFLPKKDFGDASEMIYQSLKPAFDEGLGYVIMLGSLIIGVCLPEIHRDGERRIHRPDGPAITWGEHKEWMWHGVTIPSEWVETDPDQIDPMTALNHPNVEQRRAFCEIVGWERIIQKLDPVVIDEDPDSRIGTLCEVDLPDNGKQRFLRVVEPSTGRKFALLAPMEVNTALAAQSAIAQVPEEIFKLGFVRT